MPTAEAPSLLIIDDDPDMAELLGHMADILGYEHRFVSTGAEALEAIEARQPDAIVLDIMLEGTDGWQMFERLAAVTPAPIIFITAYLSGENRSRASALRADGFLAKPIAHQDFASTLARALGQPARRLTA